MKALLIILWPAIAYMCGFLHGWSTLNRKITPILRDIESQLEQAGILKAR